MLQRLLEQDRPEPELEQKNWGRHIEDAKAKGLRVPIRS
jgi:hypothetical protein